MMDAYGEGVLLRTDPDPVVVVCQPRLQGSWLVLDDLTVRQVRIRTATIDRVEVVHRWNDDHGSETDSPSFAVELGTETGRAYRISDWGEARVARAFAAAVWTTIVSGVNE